MNIPSPQEIIDAVKNNMFNKLSSTYFLMREKVSKKQPKNEVYMKKLGVVLKDGKYLYDAKNIENVEVSAEESSAVEVRTKPDEEKKDV